MTRPSNWRAWLAFAHDVSAAALAWMAMFWLRFNLDVPEPFIADMALTLAWVVPLQAGIFVALGLYRGLWRFASTVDLQRIVLAAGLGALLVPVVLVMLQLQTVVPRSVLLFYPLVLIFLMAGSRFAYRIWKEHRLYSPFAALGEPVLIVGAGEAGARLSREFARSRQWRVVGLLDDDMRKHGRLLRNVDVLGPIAEPAALGGTLRRAQGDHRAAVGGTRRAPARRRDLRGEPPRSADGAVLRGPDQRPPRARRRSATSSSTTCSAATRSCSTATGLAEWLGNRVVMVTGAGGSIGAELCRQIARFRPARLVLFDVSEAALYEIQIVARGRSSRSCRCRRWSATSSTRRWSRTSSPASIRASSSTPRRTSTCR